MSCRETRTCRLPIRSTRTVKPAVELFPPGINARNRPNRSRFDSSAVGVGVLERRHSLAVAVHHDVDPLALEELAERALDDGGLGRLHLEPVAVFLHRLRDLHGGPVADGLARVVGL